MVCVLSDSDSESRGESRDLAWAKGGSLGILKVLESVETPSPVPRAVRAWLRACGSWGGGRFLFRRYAFEL